MDLIARLRAWSYFRQRLAEPATTLEGALRAVVAVYATHPTAPLALWARAHTFGPAAYRRLDREGQALRIPAMRGTIFLVPRDAAARIFTAVRPPAARVLRSLKRHGFSTEDYERFARRILAAAREPLRPDHLHDVVDIKGERLGTVLRCLRYEGRLLALAGDSLNLSVHRYVATSGWVPQGLDAGDPSEALAWLAGQYLRAYGPARVEDFAWWAGLAKGGAARAIKAQETVDLGNGLLLPAGDEVSFGRVKLVRGTVDLLPKWDAYTMGHAPDGRRRFVHPDVQDRVYTLIEAGLSGDGNPVVLVDGQAVATWTYTRKEGARVQPFDTPGTTIRRTVEEKLGAVTGLLSS